MTILERLDRLQKSNQPIAFVVAVIRKYVEDGGARLSATVAYYAFFSVFPALLALVAITGFVLRGNPEFRADVIDSAAGQFPVIGDSITENSLGGSTWALVVGIVGALWAGLGTMVASQHAFNTVWGVPWHSRPNPVRARIRGLVMFAVIGVVLVGGTILTNIVASVPLPGAARVAIAVANIAVNIALGTLAFQILTERMIPWRELLPGAVLAGSAFYAMQNLGSWLVTNFLTGSSDTYGSFALVIGLLSWFHIISRITLISAEVNVVLAGRLYPRSLFGDDLTDGDRRALHAFQRAAARHELVVPQSPPVTDNGSGDQDREGAPTTDQPVEETT